MIDATHERCVATWLRFGDDDAARRRRGAFVRELQPNASKLATDLCVGYDRARRLHCGSQPTAAEARTLAAMLRDKRERLATLERGLANGAIAN